MWAETALNIIPSLMGFTLGGMAILLAFSNENFLKAIQEDGKPRSLFMQGVSAFFHFILIQTLAITLALIAKSAANDVISAIGFFLLTYGLLSALSVAGLLLQISRVFNAAGSLPNSPDGERNKNPAEPPDQIN